MRIILLGVSIAANIIMALTINYGGAFIKLQEKYEIRTGYIQTATVCPEGFHAKEERSTICLKERK